MASRSSTNNTRNVFRQLLPLGLLIRGVDFERIEQKMKMLGDHGAYPDGEKQRVACFRGAITRKRGELGYIFPRPFLLTMTRSSKGAIDRKIRITNEAARGRQSRKFQDICPPLATPFFEFFFSNIFFSRATWARQLRFKFRMDSFKNAPSTRLQIFSQNRKLLKSGAKIQQKPSIKIFFFDRRHACQISAKTDNGEKSSS